MYHFMNKRKQHDSMIRNLISETIEMLQAQDESKKSGKCSESYIPVNHIRDTLISSEKRLCKSFFLEKNILMTVNINF